MTTIARGPTRRELPAAFHHAVVALSADDLANLHAPDALYEFPSLAPNRQQR
jgi:uncharacterized protein